MLTASGCAAAGRELDQFFDVAELGAVVTKSIMLDAAVRPGDAADGRDAQRHAQLDRPAGTGHRRLPRTTTCRGCTSSGARAVVSIAGGSVEEYAELARRLRGAPGLVGVEVNISCPNVADRGLVFACDPDAAAAVVGAVRRHTAPSVPVLAKLSPDVTDIVTIARACVDAGADGLSMINTLLGMALDLDTMRPVLAGVTGGLSGPRDQAGRGALHLAGARRAAGRADPRAWAASRTGLDALELVLAGAARSRSAPRSSTTPSRSASGCWPSCVDALAARGFRTPARRRRPRPPTPGWPTP